MKKTPGSRDFGIPGFPDEGPTELLLLLLLTIFTIAHVWHVATFAIKQGNWPVYNLYIAIQTTFYFYNTWN